ncbi:MAG TPA: HAMP domain-containing sensor histidine kinase [Anaeromyxobacter sp.]|nr:HAMP domain-containing sensor histidine kinase [Anaeromyxobacter sp.]
MSEDLPERFERLPAGFRNALPDARRADREELEHEIHAVSRSPVVTAVLEVADAALLVLNPERQVVGFNSRVAEVAAPDDVLGRRPGEVLDCVNAQGEGGCGSLPACETCGALGAILGCQRRGRPVESECLISSERAPGRTFEFNVRAAPVAVDGTRFTVVSFRDISGEKRREVLEQVFFHDVLNTIAGLRGWAQRLERGGGDAARARERIDFLARRIEREILDHRALLLAERGTLVPARAPLRTGELVRDLALVFSGHPAARERRLEIGPPADDVELVTDRTLLLRVLVNMVRNAFEAIPAGGAVDVRCERDGASVRLSVWNAGAIPPEVQARIFQRSFSTKAPRGRGLGTYSMKLFGERYLGGEVSFASSPETGTVFTIRLPA